MSWQGYVDNQLITEGDMKFAGIYGFDGNPWGEKGIQASPCEISALVQVIRTHGDVSQGCTLGGRKYAILNCDCDEQYMVLQSKDGGKNDDEKFTCVLSLTGQACLIGAVTGGRARAGHCNVVVGRLQAYLKSVNM